MSAEREVQALLERVRELEEEGARLDARVEALASAAARLEPLP